MALFILEKKKKEISIQEKGFLEIDIYPRKNRNIYSRKKWNILEIYLFLKKIFILEKKNRNVSSRKSIYSRKILILVKYLFKKIETFFTYFFSVFTEHLRTPIFFKTRDEIQS